MEPQPVKKKKSVRKKPAGKHERLLQLCKKVDGCKEELGELVMAGDVEMMRGLEEEVWVGDRRYNMHNWNPMLVAIAHRQADAVRVIMSSHPGLHLIALLSKPYSLNDQA